jgi:hypothetical protein
MFHHRIAVRLKIAARKQAAMNDRVQGLDPPVHHLGKACHIRHIAHLKACIPQRLGGSACRQQFNAARSKRLAKVN